MVRRKLYGCFSCRRAGSQLLVCFCIYRSNTGIHCWGFAAALLNALLITCPRGTLSCPKSTKDPTPKSVLGTGGGAFLPPSALAQSVHTGSACFLLPPCFLFPLPMQSLAQQGSIPGTWGTGPGTWEGSRHAGLPPPSGHHSAPLHGPAVHGAQERPQEHMYFSSSSVCWQQRPRLLPADEREAHPMADSAGLQDAAGAGWLRHPCHRVRATVP